MTVNEWTRTHDAMVENIRLNQERIDRLMERNMELEIAAVAAIKTLEMVCHMRNPTANGGAGLATPDEQVTLEILRAALGLTL